MTVIHLSVTIPRYAGRSAAASAKSQGHRPSSGARALALAHHIEDLLESGRVVSSAEVAAYLGVTRARVSQVMALLGLSARLQEQVLTGELVVSSRGLRRFLSSAVWAVQEQVRHTSPRRGTWRPPGALQGVGASTGQYGVTTWKYDLADAGP